MISSYSIALIKLLAQMGRKWRDPKANAFILIKHGPIIS